MSLQEQPSQRTPLLSHILSSHTQGYSPFSGGYEYPSTATRFQHFRHRLKAFLSTPIFHRTILILIILDVLLVVGVLLLNLFVCELSPHSPDAPPNEPGGKPLDGMKDPDAVERMKVALDVLEETSFALGCLFMVELALTLVAFGWSYLWRFIHFLDAAVIFAGFVVDLALRGAAEEAAGLIVVLRLWRLIKIAEEVVVEAYEEAEEQLGEMKLKIDQLEQENADLRSRV